MFASISMSEKKRAFLTGTLLLTGIGFACRILGFFYRIFLSRTIGAEGLGIYHMLFPIFGICFGLCAGSIQTALSQYIAAHQEQGTSIFHTGVIISLSIAFFLAFVICHFSDFIANHILSEPRCAPFLPLIGLSVPFAALHACINGYYYGVQKSHVPALSQIVEQILRMSIVFIIASSWLHHGQTITVYLAAMGHLIGEVAAAAFSCFYLICFPPQKKSFSTNPIAIPLMTLALPLMGNRLILSCLASMESIWLPNKLELSGLSNSDALATFGVLTGMSLPFILFPSALTNSMSVLLLPSIAKDQSDGNQSSIVNSITLALRYSMYIGILCVGIFSLFGNALGDSVFHNQEAGYFIRVLGWICPFLYLSTTLGSILNGLGHTKTTFFNNIFSMLIRISFVLFVVPQYGILAYLWGLLVSELLLASLNIYHLKKKIPFMWDAWNLLAKPIFALIVAIGIYYSILQLYQPFVGTHLFLATVLEIFLLSVVYLGGLFLSQ